MQKYKYLSSFSPQTTLPSIFYANAVYTHPTRRRWTFWKSSERIWVLNDISRSKISRERIVDSQRILDAIWRGEGKTKKRKVEDLSRFGVLETQFCKKMQISTDNERRGVLEEYLNLLPHSLATGKPISTYIQSTAKTISEQEDVLLLFKRVEHLIPKRSLSKVFEAMIVKICPRDALLAGKMLSDWMNMGNSVSLKTLNTLMDCLFVVGEDEKAEGVFSVLMQVYGKGNGNTFDVLVRATQSHSDVIQVLKLGREWGVKTMGVSVVNKYLDFGDQRSLLELLKESELHGVLLDLPARRKVVRVLIPHLSFDYILSILPTGWDVPTLGCLLRNSKDSRVLDLVKKEGWKGLEVPLISYLYKVGDLTFLLELYGSMQPTSDMLLEFSRGELGLSIVKDALKKGNVMTMDVLECLLNRVTVDELDNVKEILPLIVGLDLAQVELLFRQMFSRLCLNDHVEELVQLYMEVLSSNSSH
jgi:hypothetical protein